MLNPLQGLFNAIAYGNLGAVCLDWSRQVCRDSGAVAYFSGEYIDVDFRVGRGSIHSKSRTKRHTSSN